MSNKQLRIKNKTKLETKKEGGGKNKKKKRKHTFTRVTKTNRVKTVFYPSYTKNRKIK